MIRTLKTVVAALALTFAASVAEAAPPPAAYFARYAAIEQVNISPDGKHIMALTSPDGVSRTISIWKTDALDQPPMVILPLERMTYRYVRFLKNDRIAVNAQQLFTQDDRKGHLNKTFITDLEGKKWSEALKVDAGRDDYATYLEKLVQSRVISRMPLDPKNILVENFSFDGMGDIYLVDVYSGAAKRIDRASDKFFGPQVDVKGDIRAKLSGDFDNGKFYIALYLKHPDTGQFQEHFRWYAKDREPIGVAGFTTDPNLVYLLTNRGQDKTGIFLYDIRQRKILEPEFQHKVFDAADVIQSTAPVDADEVLGFTYNGERGGIYWTDPAMAALDKGVKQAMGVKTAPVQWKDIATGAVATVNVIDGAGAQIISMTDDRKMAIVEKSGPELAPEYYLLSEGGKLALLGKSRPALDAGTLGSTRLVEYTARDGLLIPAFITTPPASFGAGPHPAIILPHGGPWGRDEMDWDATGWTQYFASRGYVVVQPQFRGSDGWGQKLWRAGDAEWGQKMQDDNDDAAKWLIDQKLAAPDRIALWGYSYGGYAAFAAAIRPNGLYQCSIAGAGAADLEGFKYATFTDRFQREFQQPTIDGLNVIDHAKEAKIPMLIYHGDHDQIVQLKESKEFVSALKSAGLPHRYIEIKDMGHTSDTWRPAMIELQLTEVEKYLTTECGPGGL